MPNYWRSTIMNAQMTIPGISLASSALGRIGDHVRQYFGCHPNQIGNKPGGGRGITNYCFVWQALNSTQRRSADTVIGGTWVARSCVYNVSISTRNSTVVEHDVYSTREGIPSHSSRWTSWRSSVFRPSWWKMEPSPTYPSLKKYIIMTKDTP